MKSKRLLNNFRRFCLYFLLIILLVYFYIEHHNFLMAHAIFVQIFVLFLMFVTLTETINASQEQINEMRQIENEKKLVAVEALLYELEINKMWVKQFIKDCSPEGGHLKPNATWVWNPPQLVSYEKYFSMVCSGDSKLTYSLVSLYSKLKSCEIITYFIHTLKSHEGISTVDLTADYNEKLYHICYSINDSFDEPIRSLEHMKQALIK